MQTVKQSLMALTSMTVGYVRPFPIGRMIAYLRLVV